MLATGDKVLFGNETLLVTEINDDGYLLLNDQDKFILCHPMHAHLLIKPRGCVSMPGGQKIAVRVIGCDRGRLTCLPVNGALSAPFTTDESNYTPSV